MKIPSFFCNLTVSALAALLLTPGTVSAVNLISNGDFQAGSTGFTTTYFDSTGIYNLTQDGTIYVGNDPGAQNSYFVNGPNSANGLGGFFDHTLGNSSGLMLMVNGNADTQANVWKIAAPLSVIAGSPYRFSGYVSNINGYTTPEQEPALSFQLSLDNGLNWQALTTSAAPADPAVWYLTEVDGVFADPSSSVLIRLLNAQSSLSGNDFAIDDLFFGLAADAPDIADNPFNPANAQAFTGQAVPEPSTWMMLALGISGLILLRRKHGHA